MKKLELFRGDASVGAHVTLHLTHGNDISGRVDELDEAYIRLYSEGNSITIFEELLAGWEVHDGSTSAAAANLANPTPSPRHVDNEPAPPVAPTAPASTASPEALERFTKIKAEFSVAVDRARLVPPEPDFRFPETEFPAQRVDEERRKWDRAQNQYNYALKVKEISRLNDIVAQILAPLQARYPGSATTNALLGRVLLKLDRRSDAIEHLSAAAALADEPAQWHALAAAAQENTGLQCYALRRLFRLVPPVSAEDAWFRYLGVAIGHHDLRNTAQVIQHWHEQPATAPDIQGLLSDSVIYLLSALGVNALVVHGAAAQLHSPAALPSGWEHEFTNSASPSDAILAAERRFVHPDAPARASTPVRVLDKDDDSRTGRVTSFGNQRFGFIDAQSGRTHYFRIDDVADERLRDALLDGTWRAFGAIEFELLPSHGQKYDRATKILPLQDSQSLLQRAKHLLDISQPAQAMALIRRVLATEPTDEAALRLEQTVKDTIREGLHDGTGLPKGKGPYARAKRAQLVDFDLKKGEELLRQAIEQGDNRESAVKDLASLLNQQGRVNEAIVLLENNSKRKPTGESPYDNMLATLYQHAGRHNDAIPVLNRLHGAAPPPKKNLLLMRIAFSHLRCSRYDKAEDVLRQILSTVPHDRTALRLLAALEDARRAESSAEAVDIIGGLGMLVDEGMDLSSLARAAIDRCTYHGVDPKRVETGVADDKDVARVVDLAKTLGTQRPRDRAAYYLSAAALLERTAQERQSGRIYNYLRSYFTSMADASWSDRKPADVVRSYYIESLALVDDDGLDEAWRTLIRYLATFSPHLLKEVEAKLPRAPGYGHGISRPKYISALQKILAIVEPNAGSEWPDGLITVGAQSSFAKDGIGEAFMSSPILLPTFKNLLAHNRHETRDVKATWDERCREHARTHRRRLSVCRTLTRYQATVAAMESLSEELSNAIAEIRTGVDRRRLTTLVDIVDAARKFCVSSDFEERERNYLHVTTQAEDFSNEVVNAPTQYSREGLLPIADHLKSLIEEEYVQMDLTSGAELDLRLVVDKYLRGQQGELRLQIKVSNKPGCSPASSVRIGLGPEDSKYFDAERWEREVVTSLRGGVH